MKVMKKILFIASIAVVAGVNLMFFGAFGWPLRSAMILSNIGMGIAALGLVVLLVCAGVLAVSALVRLWGKKR
ncbi:MAG: hypothetical protein FWE08_02285 [Oscillospiraceae bacterium]|nr:hypothetical protein [Oscillospiraceae bacterium]